MTEKILWEAKQDFIYESNEIVKNWTTFLSEDTDQLQIVDWTWKDCIRLSLACKDGKQTSSDFPIYVYDVCVDKKDEPDIRNFINCHRFKIM